MPSVEGGNERGGSLMAQQEARSGEQRDAHDSVVSDCPQ
jgi:hypothetical protein